MESVLDAQMSLPYALAVVACSGHADLPQFSPPRTQDREAMRLMEAVELVVDLPADHTAGPTVEVWRTSGAVVAAQVAIAKGHPDAPLSDGELHAKAQSLMEPVMGAERFARIAETITSLERLSDFGQLAALLQVA